MKKETQKKAIAIGSCILLAGAAFGAGAVLMPREVVKQVQVPVVKEVTKEVKVEVPVEKIVEKVVEHNVTVEVPVDNGNLNMVLKELVEKNGNVEYLTDGLDKNEVDLIVERLVLKNEWESLARARVKADLAHELNKEVVDGTKLYDSDLRAIWMDEESITFDGMDYDQHDVEVVIPFTIRQNDQRFEGVARVVIIEDKVDDLVVDSISKA